ncbi:MAG: hypothetical protein ACREC8_11030, partial [Limisphaerales bacterium]
ADTFDVTSRGNPAGIVKDKQRGVGDMTFRHFNGQIQNVRLFKSDDLQNIFISKRRNIRQEFF